MHGMNIKVLYQVIPRSLISSSLDTAFPLYREQDGAPRRIWIVLEKRKVPWKLQVFEAVCLSFLFFWDTTPRHWLSVSDVSVQR